MPITIKTANVKYKNSQGQYVGVNSVSDNVTNDQIAAIQSAGEAQLSNINSALQEAKDSGEFDGPQGPKGDTGAIGPKGDTGATGPQGPKGDPGDLQLDATLQSSTAAAPANQVGELKSALSDATQLPAGINVDVGVRKTASSENEILSIFPFRTNGYTSVKIAHTKENLISTPYSGGSKTVNGIAFSMDTSDNLLRISGTRPGGASGNYTITSGTAVTAGKHVLCGASGLELSAATGPYFNLQIKSGNTRLAQGNLNNNDIIEYTFEDASSVDVNIFLYGKYTVDGVMYPLFGRGETLEKSVGSGFFGGSFNWTTGKLISLYDSTGILLPEPIETDIGAVAITMYDGENWFYSDSGKIEIDKHVTLQEKLEEAGKTIFYHSVAELRNADLSSGDTVITLGYYSAGDGGGSTYKIRDAVVSDVDDSGSILKIGNLTAELIPSRDGCVDIRQFGAKGDGANDDTSAIANALDYADNVYFSNGTYIVSSDNLIKQRQTIELAEDAVIKPSINTTIFTMRSNSSLIGKGQIYTFHLGNNYDENVIVLENDSSSDLQNIVISGIRFTGSFKNGTAIYANSDLSQVLYCRFIGINIYAFAYGFKFDRTNYSIGELYVDAVINESACAFYGDIGTSFLKLTGETGLENEISSYVIELLRSNYCFVYNGMVDIGNPNRIPYGVHLSGGSNTVCGIILKQAIVDEGRWNNVGHLYSDGISSRFGLNTTNNRYNNILSNVTKRYNTSVAMTNCTVSEVISGTQYDSDVFVESLADISPTKAWVFTGIDSTLPAIVQIDIQGIGLKPNRLEYEYLPMIGYANQGCGFNEISMLGRKDGSQEYELIGKIEYSKDTATGSWAGRSYKWMDGGVELPRANQLDSWVYEDIRIILSAEKTETYPCVGTITALFLGGWCMDNHQAFIQSNGDDIYGDLTFSDGKGVILKSPNGTKYKLTVDNSGVISANPVT